MTKASNGARGSLREAIFAASNRELQSIKLTIFGQEVEVRQPTVKQITALAKRAQVEGSSAIINILTEYCYVPGTNEKVFEDGDAEALMELPSGKWLTDLNAAVSTLSGVDVAAAEKNSAGTGSVLQ